MYLQTSLYQLQSIIRMGTSIRFVCTQSSYCKLRKGYFWYMLNVIIKDQLFKIRHWSLLRLYYHSVIETINKKNIFFYGTTYANIIKNKAKL